MKLGEYDLFHRTIERTMNNWRDTNISLFCYEMIALIRLLQDLTDNDVDVIVDHKKQIVGLTYTIPGTPRRAEERKTIRSKYMHENRIYGYQSFDEWEGI